MSARLLLLVLCALPACGVVAKGGPGGNSEGSEGQGDGEGDGDAEGDGDGDDGEAGAVTRTFVYVGGYERNGDTYPFRSFELDRKSFALTEIGSPIDLGPNPSFISVNTVGRPFLYVANDVDGEAGGVTVASLDLETGVARLHDHESTGSGFAFATLDWSAKWLLAASHDGGSVSVFPVREDGALGDAVDSEELGGSPRSIRSDGLASWVYVPNAAQNQIEQLAFSAETGQLEPNPTSAFTELACGPSFISMHPNGASSAFVTCEHEPVLTHFDVLENGTLEEVASVRTVPEGSDESADTHVELNLDGTRVYVSNSDQHSIGVFAVTGDRKLTLLEYVDTQGLHPRSFHIDDELMVVANQGSSGGEDGNLRVFRIGGDGRLSPRGGVDGLKEPTAVVIVRGPSHH